MSYLTERRIVPERMDASDADAAELAGSLAFIRRVNARLGGTSAALRPLVGWLRAWPRDHPVRILDVGTGSADIPLAIARWGASRPFPMEIVAVDRHPITLEVAREHVRDEPAISVVAADALQLDQHFEAHSFDFAHAGMFLHHLSDLQVMTVLRLMQRLTRCGLIWNDLVRSRLGRAGAALLTRAAPSMARHDAVASVDAGFTRREAIDLARRVGLPNVRYRRHLHYRFTLTSVVAEDAAA